MTQLPTDLAKNMVFREYMSDMCHSRVWYSKCDHYRYGLSRHWAEAGKTALFLMLNPSTADEYRNDPTVARCETRARSMGYAGMMIANIFAFRATHPTNLKQANAPVGDLNDAVLEHWTNAADVTIAAWGAHGAHLDRAYEVSDHLPQTACHLGLTKHGHPRHPLYVSFETQPQAWPKELRYKSVP